MDNVVYTGTRRSLVDRMKLAAMLDVSVYEEVEADTTATTQAAIVVGIVAVCAAIGGARGGGRGAIGALIAAYVGWIIWSYITYFVGTRVFKGTATPGELLRTIGFAQSAGILYILGIIPILGVLAKLIVAVWLLVASVIAVRQALDIDTTKAVLTSIIGLVAYVIVAAVVGMVLGISSHMF